MTAFSGAVALDETGTVRSHQIQYSLESPELEPDGNSGWTTIGTKTINMRFVTEILARTDGEARQKLTELFTDLPSS